jgi:hypothetical protein
LAWGLGTPLQDVHNAPTEVEHRDRDRPRRGYGVLYKGRLPVVRADDVIRYGDSSALLDDGMEHAFERMYAGGINRVSGERAGQNMTQTIVEKEHELDESPMLSRFMAGCSRSYGSLDYTFSRLTSGTYYALVSSVAGGTGFNVRTANIAQETVQN